jgi:hypothetical protein
MERAESSPIRMQHKKEAQERQEDLVVRVRADVVFVSYDLQQPKSQYV